jgi:hypothetical protein
MSRQNKNNNKLRIKDNRNKRIGQLAVVPTPSARTPQKSLMLDNKNIDVNSVQSMKGGKSYSEKAKMQGLYITITASIRKFREANRDSTFSQLYQHLIDNFPTVFENMSSHPSNVSKIISADPQWSQAYFCNLSLIELAEQRMSEVLTDESIDNSTKINAYDKVWKYELAKRQLDKDQTQNNEDNKVELNVNISVEDDDE